uniref:Uncharacterized protein n=1 Tax=Rhodnius prolixus TaxID=13249 RepID=T1IB99_RHOPR
MSLCLNLNDVENIDGIYAALNKYGVCVDYDDEKQMELKKRIIIVTYPKECLYQGGRVFRFLALGDIISYLVNIEVNTFLAFWNPKMFRTFDTNEPSFSIGPQNSIVWLIPNMADFVNYDESIEKDTDSGLTNSPEREHITVQRMCTAGPSHSNHCCSHSPQKETILSYNCRNKNGLLLEDLTRNLSSNSTDLNRNTENRRTTEIKNKYTGGYFHIRSCCAIPSCEKSTAAELKRKNPQRDGNSNNRRYFFGKAVKCNNEKEKITNSSSNEEGSRNDAVCNTVFKVIKGHDTCEQPGGETCCANYYRSNIVDKRTREPFNEEPRSSCYLMKVKGCSRNEELLDKKYNSSSAERQQRLISEQVNTNKSTYFSQKHSMQFSPSKNANTKNFKKQCIENKSCSSKSNVIKDTMIENVISTKLARNKLVGVNEAEWNLLDKVLTRNNIIIKKKRKLFFADPHASDALIDVNTSIKNKRNCIGIKNKDMQQIQGICNNDPVPSRLCRRDVEEKFKKSAKNQIKISFDQSSTNSAFTKNKLSSDESVSSSDSDSGSRIKKKILNDRLLIRRRKRCKKKSRRSEARNDTTNTSSSEEKLSFRDEQSDLRIVSVYTLTGDDEQLLKKYCSLGKRLPSQKVKDLTSKSHLTNFKSGSKRIIQKNNSDNKNTNYKMSKIEVVKIAEIKNTNPNCSNNASRAENSNSVIAHGKDCLNNSSDDTNLFIANLGNQVNNKHSHSLSSVESSCTKVLNNSSDSSQSE